MANEQYRFRKFRRDFRKPGSTRQALMYQARLIQVGKISLQQCRKMGILAPETVELLHGLDCYRLPTAPSCPPSHKELHCMVGSVPYGLVRWVGMSLILGGGPTPRPPKGGMAGEVRQHTQGSQPYTFLLNQKKKPKKNPTCTVTDPIKSP